MSLTDCQACDAANEAYAIEVDELEAERVMLEDALQKRIYFVENQVCSGLRIFAFTFATKAKLDRCSCRW